VKTIFGVKEKPAEPVKSASDMMREELDQATVASQKFSAWVEALTVERQELLAGVLQDPVGVATRLEEVSALVGQAGELRHLINARLDELRRRLKSRGEWESMDRARRQRLDIEKKQPRFRGFV